MTTHLRFLHVCERQFAGLPGDDPRQRRCDTCSTVVHNLDALPPDARSELLTRAHAEQTTVCVSLALPPDSARACRTGAPVDATASADLAVAAAPAFPPIRTAGVAVVVPDVPRLPRLDDASFAWRTLAADGPKVHAELATLAPAFALTSRDGRHWRHHDAQTDLWIDVVAEPHAQHTRVGVRIAPENAAPPVSEGLVRNYARVAALIGAPAWLILVLALWIADLPLAVVLFGPTAVLLLLVAVMAGFVGVNAIGERAKQRAIDRWSADWQARFWPALTARVAEARAYR